MATMPAVRMQTPTLCQLDVTISECSLEDRQGPEGTILYECLCHGYERAQMEHLD